MFKQIDQKDYPTIKTFVNNLKYKVSVNSILDGNTQGEVFADDAEKPTIALIFEKHQLVTVFGEIDIKCFNTAFTSLLKERIAPHFSKLNEHGLLISLFPEKYWIPVSNQIIEENYLLNCFRWTSKLDLQHYLEFKNKFTQPLPVHYKLCRITENIVSAEQNSELKDRILTYWPDIESFINTGFGFCAVKDSQVIASALSYTIGDLRNYEIDIETFAEEERNKGLATHCSIAYLDYCLENNYQPYYWETDWDNIASQKLATKIGFIGSVSENRYQFRFNRADNYLINTFCHIRDNKEIDMDYINLAINKAFADSNLKANPRYIYSVALKLTENGIKNHVFFLLDELFKSDIQYLGYVKDNDSFKPLHDTPEWAELLKTYQ